MKSQGPSTRNALFHGHKVRLKGKRVSIKELVKQMTTDRNSGHRGGGREITELSSVMPGNAVKLAQTA
jgi:hypothetical protein